LDLPTGLVDIQTHHDYQETSLMMRQLLRVAVAGSLFVRAAAAGTQDISIGTGGTGGIYYPMGGGFAAVLSKHVPGMQAPAEVSGGDPHQTTMQCWKDAVPAKSHRHRANDADCGGLCAGLFDTDRRHDRDRPGSAALATQYLRGRPVPA
jgi:hypothetical protein